MENIFYEYQRDKSTEMGIFKGKSNKAARHFHRNIEILYVIDGEVEATVGDESFVAKKDEIIFVHNYFVHSFYPKTEYEKYVLIVTANYAEDIDKILKTSTLPPHLSDTEYNKKELYPIFKKLLDGRDDMSILVKKGYVNLIIGLFFEKYPAINVKTPANIEIMVDILHYINDHYKEPLTLDSVASAFGYNKCYFSRIFNRYIGESLSGYINVVRLQNFMRLAHGVENPQISSLAESCGFSSMTTFYRAFEKIYGESPRKYFARK